MQIPGVKGVPRNAKSVPSLVKRLKIDPELVRSHLAPDPTLDRFTRDNYFSDPGGPLAPDPILVTFEPFHEGCHTFGIPGDPFHTWYLHL